MRIQGIAEHITFDNLSGADFACHQRACGFRALVQGALLVASMIVVMAPFSVVAAQAIGTPDMLDRLTGAPANAAVAFAGVALWIFMFGIPALRAFARMGRRQDIKIADGYVEVSEKTLIGKNNWTLPLSDFEGLSHHIRTSLSGARQELILVHPQLSKCLLLAMGDTITQNEAETLASKLGLPVLPEGLLHRRRKTFRMPRFALSLPATALRT